MCLTIQIMSLDVRDVAEVNKRAKTIGYIRKKGAWHRFRSHHALTLFARSFLYFLASHISRLILSNLSDSNSTFCMPSMSLSEQNLMIVAEIRGERSRQRYQVSSQLCSLFFLTGPVTTMYSWQISHFYSVINSRPKWKITIRLTASGELLALCVLSA